MELTATQIEKIEKLLQAADVAPETIAQRLEQLSQIDATVVASPNFWGKGAEARMYFHISGTNKNRVCYIDLVRGTIQAQGKSQYTTLHKINNEQFDVV